MFPWFNGGNKIYYSFSNLKSYFLNDQNLFISEHPLYISIYFFKRNVFLPQFNSIQNQTNIFLFSFFFFKMNIKKNFVLILFKFYDPFEQKVKEIKKLH